jgi:hypothetical protein
MQKNDWLMLTGVVPISHMFYLFNDKIAELFYRPLQFQAFGNLMSKVLEAKQVLSEGSFFVYRKDDDERYRLKSKAGLLRLGSYDGDDVRDVAELTIIKNPFSIQSLDIEVRLALIEEHNKQIPSIRKIAKTHPLTDVAYLEKNDDGALCYFFDGEGYRSLEHKCHLAFFVVPQVNLR